MTTTTTKKTTKKRQTARLRPSQVLLALAPFAVLAIGARVLVPRVGVAIARHVVAVASWASIDARFAEEGGPPGADSANVPSPPPIPLAREPARAARRAKTESGEWTPAPAFHRGPATIFISANRLLHLGPKQLRGVEGTTVVDGNGRPVGVRLSGVGALGVGLSDGDVVTAIGGRATPAADDAIAAGIAAWTAGLHTIQATVVRGGETIAVTVEIPSIDASDAGIRGVSSSTNQGSGRM